MSNPFMAFLLKADWRRYAYLRISCITSITNYGITSLTGDTNENSFVQVR
jgi:hypothetical protein